MQYNDNWVTSGIQKKCHACSYDNEKSIKIDFEHKLIPLCFCGMSKGQPSMFTDLSDLYYVQQAEKASVIMQASVCVNL